MIKANPWCIVAMYKEDPYGDRAACFDRVYGLFSTELAAEIALSTLKEHRPNWYADRDFEITTINLDWKEL